MNETLGFKIVINLLLLIGFISSVIAAEDIKFENISIEQGLSQNSIRCIYQDSEGYIWIGTEDGLNKYDGFTFTVFRSNVDDTTSISENIITSIFEDHQNNLWVATISGSLNKYNRETGNFKQYLIDNQRNIYPSPFNGIAYMYEDRSGNLWAYNRSVYKYLPEEDIFQQMAINIEEVDYSVSFLYEDSEHDFWIGTDFGLYNYNWTDGTYELYKPQTSKMDTMVIAMFTIAEDPGGIFWIGTNRGLYKFDKNTRKFIENLQIDNYVTNGAIHTDIPTIINDQQYLWMTWQNWINNTIGISRLNKATKELSVYYLNVDKSISISSNVPVNMIEDKSGVMWVGTFLSGIFKFEKERKFHTMMAANTINAFWEDKNDNLWIATSSNGLFRNDEKNNTKINLPTRFQNTPINTLIEDHNGFIWFGTYEGLFRISNLNEKSSLSHVEQFLQSSVKIIVEDLQHRLWIGSEGSLCVIDPVNKKTIYFYNEPDNPNSINNNSIESLLVDKTTGDIWVGTWGGLSRLILPKNQELTADNIKFISFVHETNNTSTISDNRVISLCMDKKGTLWAGTYGGGINSIEFKSSEGKDEETYNIKNYTIGNGLPNNVIYGILCDNNNNIWISTNNGLSELNQENGIFNNYNINDGLQSNQFFWRASYQSPSGKMYFGGINGYNAFYPDSIKVNNYVPPVKITGFSIFNKIMVPGAKGSPLVNQIDKTKEITINHNQSVISFDYVALNYLAGQNNKYAYMMEGFDEDWQYVDTQRKTTYTNLNPGTYIFRVKASNNDGIWNEEGTSLKINILPPWWMTLWFKIIASLFIVAVIVSFFYIRTATLRKQKKLLIKKVEERTNDLNEKNALLVKQSNDLIETNALLEIKQETISYQSEELKVIAEYLEETNKELTQINTTKDKLFSIIAHDLKNPFNVILGYTDLLIEYFDTWDNDQKLNALAYLKESSGNAYNLLENLLNWSRSQTGTLEFNPELTGVSECIGLVIQETISFARSKGVELVNQINNNQLQIYSDTNMLKFICRNLIMNAIKFSCEGNKVFVNVDNKNPESFCFSIRDEGVGMDKEKIETLFNLEKNTSDYGTNGEKGTGLGLILCKEFVDKHNGKIWVESKKGVGTTFFFTIPMQQ